MDCEKLTIDLKARTPLEAGCCAAKATCRVSLFTACSMQRIRRLFPDVLMLPASPSFPAALSRRILSAARQIALCCTGIGSQAKWASKVAQRVDGCRAGYHQCSGHCTRLVATICPYLTRWTHYYCTRAKTPFEPIQLHNTDFSSVSKVTGTPVSR